jgi:hypothetical protein
MTIRRTLAAALAATALAATAASAQPADMHASTALGTAQAQPQRQDLRGEHAKDAAIQQRQDFRSPDAIDAAIHPTKPFTAPASPGHPAEAGNTTPLPPVTAEALSTSDDGIDWATLGLGIAGLVLFLGGVLALATRGRPAPRTGASA